MKTEYEGVAVVPQESPETTPNRSEPGGITASGAAEPSLDRRAEARYPCADPCEVILPATGGRSTGTVRDISRSGLRIESSMPISKGMEIEIVLPKQVVIFGEVRHCRGLDGGYQVGVRIREVFHRWVRHVYHLDDDQISLYLVGKGLTAPEVMRVREHLMGCRTCQERLAEADAILNPRLQRRVQKAD
jgi:hypothetical protein